MKTLNVLKYQDAKFTQLGNFDILCEFKDFTDCVSQSIIPLRVQFQKERGSWVFVKLPKNDFSPFKHGERVPEHLQSVLFDVVSLFEAKFQDVQSEQAHEIDDLINF